MNYRKHRASEWLRKIIIYRVGGRVALPRTKHGVEKKLHGGRIGLSYLVFANILLIQSTKPYFPLSDLHYLQLL